MIKECGDCQRCCDGTFTDSINGHMMGDGKPCFFLSIGGCNIYQDRPKDPCINYKCLWLEDDDVPDFMKPNSAQAIVDSRQTEDGVKYLMITGNEDSYSTKVFLYAAEYAQLKQIPLVYPRNGSLSFIGKPQDCQKILTSLNKKDEKFKSGII